MQEQIVKELQEHQDTIGKLLETQKEVIERIAKVMTESYATGNKVVLFGNGGSAADAQHIAAEFMGRYKMERGAMAAIAFGTNNSIITAIGNDFGFEYIFERQVDGMVNPKDVVIGISTSGNAENVLRGLQKAKEKGATTIAFTGKNKGKLQEIENSIDIFLHVPSTNTPRIQEAHMIIGHIISGLVEQEVFARKNMISNLANIKLVALDFDGVLTDNRVLVSSNGAESVLCSREDSLGIDLLKKNGVEVIVISKEKNEVVEQRCLKLNIPCLNGVDEKYACLAQEMGKRNLQKEQVCFVGNDVPDEECIQEVGFGVAVADSTESTIQAADYVTKKKGGKGAVREVADLIVRKSNG